MLNNVFNINNSDCNFGHKAQYKSSVFKLFQKNLQNYYSIYLFAFPFSTDHTELSVTEADEVKIDADIEELRQQIINVSVVLIFFFSN